MPKFLIIKPSSLGDIIHGLQVADSLKDQIPGASITWVVSKPFLGLVQACDAVDRCLVFDRSGGLRSFLRLLKEIRHEHYDVVMDMQGLARSGLMTLASRATLKLGRSDAREGAGLAYQLKAPLPLAGKDSHAVDILSAFLPLISLENTPSRHLTFSKTSPWEAPWGAGKALLLFPNSRRKEKEWPYFSDLVEGLLGENIPLPIAWAGQEPLPLSDDWPKDRFFDLIGKTSLAQLPDVIASAKLVVSNDSGPMHLAAAQGVPVLALFGPTAPERYGPYPLNAPDHWVLQAEGGDLRRLSAATVVRAILETGALLEAHP
jgi:ADP-heptose:LPS heptosyltransferase